MTFHEDNRKPYDPSFGAPRRTGTGSKRAVEQPPSLVETLIGAVVIVVISQVSCAFVFWLLSILFDVPMPWSNTR